MSSEIITLIISSVSATISAPIGAWVGAKLQSQKYKTEIDGLRAEVQKKLAGVKDSELENVRKANDILVEGIVTPLKKEINSLRRDVDKFRKAVEKIPSCAHADNCPVSRQLQKLEERDSRAEGGESGK
jgi:hypothetical protein